MSVWDVISDKTTNRTDDWANFNRKAVSKYMSLPPEAQVTSAEHTLTAIMGERWIVQFRLPTNRSPEEWLARIAEASGKRASFRRTALYYDGYPTYDLWRLEYHAVDGSYSARGGWD